MGARADLERAPSTGRPLKAVIDSNVLIAAVCSARGAPAEVLERWRSGAFEIVSSAIQLRELAAALARARVRRRVNEEDAQALLALIRARSEIIPDVEPVGVRSRDPKDDYLLGLAQSAAAILVTGDKDLLALTDLPIETPRAFLQRLVAFEEGRGSYRLTGSRATRRGGRPRTGRLRRASPTASHLS